MCEGVYQLGFLSPEALLSNETWRDMVPSPVYQENLVAVVIDEFYQHACHVTSGSNVTYYIPLWNENLAHVTRRIFPSLPPPPFPRTCAPRGKIRMVCETRYNSGANARVAGFIRPVFLNEAATIFASSCKTSLDSTPSITFAKLSLIIHAI